MNASRLIAVVLAAGFVAASLSQADEPTTQPTGPTLTVRVADLRNAKGDLHLGVFDREKGFPEHRESAITWYTLPAKTESPTFAFDLPAGRYAVVVLHDENANKKLDRNFFGVPTEGHGCSNNVKPRRRATKFKEAAFDHAEDGTQITVSMQYNYN